MFYISMSWEKLWVFREFGYCDLWESRSVDSWVNIKGFEGMDGRMLGVWVSFL